ncbi:MAG: hypothetical protein DRQ02_11765 [Candidatus Latescibacterota bacterium]|nr:MAG: hypothetical protein DRQ02_11765 [Candidatus Latescibacterota bacterium]
MRFEQANLSDDKGWYVGPWNSDTWPDWRESTYREVISATFALGSVMLNLLLMILVLATLYLVVFKLLPIAGAIPLLRRGLKLEEVTGGRLLTLTVVYFPLALLAILAAAYLRGHSLTRLLGPTFSLMDFSIGAVAGIAIALINLLVDLGIKQFRQETFASTLRMMGNSHSGLAAMILVGWLAGGVLEEMYYRGFWFSEWGITFGDSLSALAISLIVSNCNGRKIFRGGHCTPNFYAPTRLRGLLAIIVRREK